MTRRAAGFTLLEIMIAIVIIGMIVSLVYGSISFTADSKNDTEAGNEVYQSVRWAMDKMDNDLTSAFISKNPNSHSIFYATTQQTADGYPMDQMTFTSFNHVKYDQNARESDQSAISYMMMPNPDTGVMTLYRREDASWNSDNMTGGEYDELVDNVISLQLQYFDGSQWLEDWDTQDPNNPPQTSDGSETTPQPQIPDQEDQMVNTLPVAVDVGILVNGPHDMPLAFHTKIRIVLSTLNLTDWENDASPSGGSSGSGSSGSGNKTAGGSNRSSGGS